MCFVVVLLYDVFLFLLGCWLGWHSWFHFVLVMEFQVCVINDDCTCPLWNFVGIRVCCVGHVF